MKQAFTIPAPDNTDLSDACLFLRVGDRHLGYAITNPGSGELIELAWYTGEEVTRDSLDTMMEAHPTLRRSWNRLSVSYDHSQSLLVPAKLYREQDVTELLQTMYGTGPGEICFTDVIESWQINNIYAVPREIHTWVSARFSNADILHQYSVAIRNLLVAEDPGYFQLDFRADEFTLICSRANELMLAQTYPYSTPADVIWYLLKACHELKLQPGEVRLGIAGLVEQQSILYRELYQYFLLPEFRLPAWSGQLAGEYPAHYFTPLNELSRCG